MIDQPIPFTIADDLEGRRVRVLEALRITRGGRSIASLDAVYDLQGVPDDLLSDTMAALDRTRSLLDIAPEPTSGGLEPTEDPAIAVAPPETAAYADVRRNIAEALRWNPRAGGYSWDLLIRGVANLELQREALSASYLHAVEALRALTAAWEADTREPS